MLLKNGDDFKILCLRFRGLEVTEEVLEPSLNLYFGTYWQVGPCAYHIIVASLRFLPLMRKRAQTEHVEKLRDVVNFDTDALDGSQDGVPCTGSDQHSAKISVSVRKTQAFSEHQCFGLTRQPGGLIVLLHRLFGGSWWLQFLKLVIFCSKVTQPLD